MFNIIQNTFFTIRSRAKSTLSTNCIFYIREPSFSKKYRSSKKIYLRTVHKCPNVHHVSQPKSEKHRFNPQSPENRETFISKKSTPPSPTNYERIIAHAAEVKFINNCYVTPITVEFGSSESEKSVNLPVKHKQFIAIKFLDPSASNKDKVIINPQ